MDLSELQRIAREEPGLRDRCLKVMDRLIENNAAPANDRRQARGQRKRVMEQSTKRLLDWAIMRNDPLSEQEVEDFFRTSVGWEALESDDSDDSGPRWSVGDAIEVKADKCKDERLKSFYRENRLDEEVGRVSETAKTNRELERHDQKFDDILVEFEGVSGPVKIPRGQKKENSGLYTPSHKDGRTHLEVVYLSAKSNTTTKKQQEQLEDYLQRGKEKGQWRHPNYYTGPAQFIQEKDNGDVWFAIDPQQRARDFTGFNPKDGDVLYLGTFGNRPSGMKQDLERWAEDRLDLERGDSRLNINWAELYG